MRQSVSKRAEMVRKKFEFPSQETHSSLLNSIPKCTTCNKAFYHWNKLSTILFHEKTHHTERPKDATEDDDEEA